MDFLNFGTTTNTFGSGTTTFQGKSGATGNAANAALDAAASAIPFGSIAKNLLDGLGLQERIDTVMKYGISSWGASSSPEEVEKLFAEHFYPYMQNTLQGMESGDIEGVANKIEQYLKINHVYFKNLRDNHSKAKSSRLSNDWAMKAVTEMQTKFRAKLNALKTQGFKITSRNETITVDDKMFPSADGNKDSLSINNLGIGTVSTRQYTIEQPTGVEIDEKGNIKPKKSNFGLVALGSGLLYAIKSGALKL